MASLLDQIKNLNTKGFTDVAIARQLGVSISYVNRLRNKARVARAPYRMPALRVDEKRAQELYDRGWNDREVAKRLQVSREAIQKWRTRRRLPSNGWKAKRSTLTS